MPKHALNVRTGCRPEVNESKRGDTFDYSKEWPSFYEAVRRVGHDNIREYLSHEHFICEECLSSFTNFAIKAKSPCILCD